MTIRNEFQDQNLLSYYKYESDLLCREEDKIWEITRYNFLVLGAISIISSTSWMASGHLLSLSILFFVLTILAVSISASVMVCYHWRYYLYQDRKSSYLEQIFQSGDLLGDVKFSAKFDEIRSEREPAYALGVWRYLKDDYWLKWVNLVPGLIAILFGLIYAHWK